PFIIMLPAIKHNLLNPKLKIDNPDTPAEREADAMAEKVVNTKQSDLYKPAAQRKCDACEASSFDEATPYREEKNLHRKEVTNTSSTNIYPAAEQALQSGGEPIDTDTRTFMEERFGYDFSNVQVHDDSQAHQSSKDIN